MSGRPGSGAAPRLLRLVARKLEEHLEGDELALETLGEAMEEEGFSGEDLLAAIAALRSLAGEAPPAGWLAGAPGRDAQRVQSAEEREWLTPEAWGYLLDLRRRGALDAVQFERVLDLLTGGEERPAGVAAAREAASRVAVGGAHGAEDLPYGDQEVAH